MVEVKPFAEAVARFKYYNSRINLQFSDLTYEVIESKKKSKIILNGVSGEFRAGELSVIIGPSGSGKTTLLNLLTGYRIHQTSGHVNINGKPLATEAFRKISRYILQESLVNSYLTIAETMLFASYIKLDHSSTKDQRQAVITDILQRFHLNERGNTRIAKLSGGERRRLCIAVELLDKPKILFLDEPTTGLDECSAMQCIKELRRFAQNGCTIVCVAHAPSARLLDMFDKMFVLAEGQCIYQGAVKHIVPYLECVNLSCPLIYNPADFIIEVSTHQYGNYHKDLVREIENGKIYEWSPPISNGNSRQATESDQTVSQSVTNLKSCQNNSNSWWCEFKWIFWRNIKQMFRDKTHILLRVFIHLFLSASVGVAYRGIGDNGRLGIYHYHLSLIIVVVSIYVSQCSMLAYVPLEIKYLKREHFNQWYRLSSYFMALLAAQLPLTAIMSFICSAIIYIPTGQPMQFPRFLQFFIIIFLTTMMGLSYGLLVGSRFNVLNSLFVAPSIMGVLIILASYPTEKTHLSHFESLLVYSSCLRHSLEGVLAALLKNNREDITCPPNEFICIFSKPDYILKLTGCKDVNVARSAAFLIGFSIIFTSVAFLTLKSRLGTSQLLERNRNYRYIKQFFIRNVNLKIYG